MKCIKFSEWVKINESQKTLFKCPHPEDKEYCKKWNLYVRGEGPMPIFQGKESIGHYQGLKARKMKTNKEKSKEGDGKRGGRYDWRKDY
jgi:hypothetical protein